MQYLIAAILLASLVSTAAAQDNVQGADPKLVQSALNVLQAQRNRALDEAASAEAQLDRARQEIADLQKQIDASKTKDEKK